MQYGGALQGQAGRHRREGMQRGTDRETVCGAAASHDKATGRFKFFQSVIHPIVASRDTMPLLQVKCTTCGAVLCKPQEACTDKFTNKAKCVTQPSSAKPAKKEEAAPDAKKEDTLGGTIPQHGVSAISVMAVGATIAAMLG